MSEETATKAAAPSDVTPGEQGTSAGTAFEQGAAPEPYATPIADRLAELERRGVEIALRDGRAKVLTGWRSLSEREREELRDRREEIIRFLAGDSADLTPEGEADTVELPLPRVYPRVYGSWRRHALRHRVGFGKAMLRQADQEPRRPDFGTAPDSLGLGDQDHAGYRREPRRPPRQEERQPRRDRPERSHIRRTK